MAENKKPCTPVEEAGRDYNELGLYLHGETAKAAMELWDMLPGWMEARRMAFIDPEYNRRMSEVIAQRAGQILKAAQDMAEWGPAELATPAAPEKPSTQALRESSGHLLRAARAMAREAADMAKAIEEELDAEDSDAVYMALDLKNKVEWIASVLGIAEENEGLGA